jgi:hypothetical protein
MANDKSQTFPHVVDKDNAVAIGAAVVGGMMTNNLILGVNAEKYHSNPKSVLQVNLHFNFYLVMI